MVSYEKTTAELMPMSPAEEALRYIYEHQLPCANGEKYPAVRSILSRDANAQRIVTNILNNLAGNGVLSEKIMFEADVDIRLSLHMRYHPLISHSHDFFEIQYALKGGFQQTIEGQDASLREGDFCFIAPHVRHNIHIFDPDTLMVNLLMRRQIFPDAFMDILSSSDLIAGFFMRALYESHTYPFLINHTGSDENIRFLMARLLETQKNHGRYTGNLLRTQVEELLLYILKDHGNDFSSKVINRKSSRNLLTILTFIQENYASVSLPMLAEQFGYNKSYLSRMLQEQTGKSFSQIVKELRFEHALQLLTTTNQSIEEIIYYTGYTDRTYFYREFKKIYHTSPAEYRKNFMKIV